MEAEEAQPAQAEAAQAQPDEPIVFLDEDNKVVLDEGAEVEALNDADENDGPIPKYAANYKGQLEMEPEWGWDVGSPLPHHGAAILPNQLVWAPAPEPLVLAPVIAHPEVQRNQL